MALTGRSVEVVLTAIIMHKVFSCTAYARNNGNEIWRLSHAQDAYQRNFYRMAFSSFLSLTQDVELFFVLPGCKFHSMH